MSADPHPTSEQLAYSDATVLRRRLEAGELTSTQLVETLLERILAIDAAGPRVNSIAALNPEAREIAEERDRQRSRGEILGPLHGIPVVVKDNIEVRGLPGLAGSTALW